MQSNWYRLANLTKKVWFFVAVGVIASAFRGLANVGFPLLTKTLIDEVLPSGNSTFLLLICAGFTALAASIVGLDFLSSYMGALASEKVTLLLGTGQKLKDVEKLINEQLQIQ